MKLQQFVVSLCLISLSMPGWARNDRLIIPDRIEWKLNTTVDGKAVELSIPKDQGRISSFGKKVQESLLAEIKRVEANQSLAKAIGKSFFQGPPIATTARLSPDYERSLNEVAISVSFADANSENPVFRSLPILKALPPYSKIHLIMPKQAEGAVRAVLHAEQLIGRSELHPAKGWSKKKENLTEYSRSTRWIRDTFLIGGDENRTPVVFKPLAYARISDLTQSDLNFLDSAWRNKHTIKPLPGFIRGGNVAVADNGAGRRVAFLGHDEINQNEAHYLYATAITPPRDLIPEIIKRIAKVPQVEILPNSTLLFHLDMAVSFISPGVAALLSPIDEKNLGNDEIVVLTTLRKALAANGFKIVNIPTTTTRIKAYQSPVNILPFKNKNSGVQSAIVPWFPDVAVTIDGQPQSLNSAIRKAYEIAGLEVIYAEDRFFDQRGNVHCTIVGLY